MRRTSSSTTSIASRSSAAPARAYGAPTPSTAIINVITRRAADTQGTLVTVGTGNEEQAITDVR
jgi:hypothetical protein